MKVKTGSRVMYNGDVFTVNTVERDNGRAVAVWCRDASGEEFYLTVDVLEEAPEDVSIDEEIASAESEIHERAEAGYYDDAYVEGPFTEPDVSWCEKMKHKWSHQKYMVKQLVPVKEVEESEYEPR